MEEDYMSDYYIARDLIAAELIEKYGLKESFRNDEILTLDSKNHSIHFTFVVPDEEEVYISKRGDKWHEGKSFMKFLHEKYLDIKSMMVVYRSLSKAIDESKGDLSPCINSFFSKISFFETEFPHYFLTIDAAV